MTCSTTWCLALLATAFCSGWSGRLSTSIAGPQRPARTARGSMTLRPRPTPRRTWSPCSVISSCASAVLAHSLDTTSDANLTSMVPVSILVMNSGSCSRILSRIVSMSALSCQESRPDAPTMITCGSCCMMKSRMRWASLSFLGSWKMPPRLSDLLSLVPGRGPLPLSWGSLMKSTMFPAASSMTATVGGPESRRLPPGPHVTAMTRSSSRYSSSSGCMICSGGVIASSQSAEA
mmetsp:Transcript_12878/g.30545  ORF Transcript_12878/g.30545 Transcript_12878/m.30545 type:complete len:234 (+) Transcript_12878:162-863(+)